MPKKVPSRLMRSSSCALYSVSDSTRTPASWSAWRSFSSTYSLCGWKPRGGGSPGTASVDGSGSAPKNAAIRAWPGTMWWSHLTLYSVYLMPRNTPAHSNVTTRQLISPRVLPSWAQRTPHAIVKLLKQQHGSVHRAENRVEEMVPVDKQFRVIAAIHGVGTEQPAEEQHLGQQERPTCRAWQK